MITLIDRSFEKNVKKFAKGNSTTAKEGN